MILAFALLLAIVGTTISYYGHRAALAADDPFHPMAWAGNTMILMAVVLVMPFEWALSIGRVFS